MKILIREVEEKDYNALLHLWNNEIGNKLVTSENIAPHYNRMKNDNRYKTFVALHENEIVGFIFSVQSFAPGFEAGHIQICGIAVKNKFQNKGIGSQLLKYLEDYAKSQNVSGIYLCTGVQRTQAHAFYKANGYDNHSWCFGKRIT